MNERSKGILEYGLYLCMFIVLSCIILHSASNEVKPPNHEGNHPITDAKIIEKIQVLDSIPLDTIVHLTYQIINLGHDSLRVLNVNPDCSCTDFIISNSVVAAGDTANITLIYNSQERLGENKINAIVKLNTNRRIYKITAYINVIERQHK